MSIKYRRSFRDREQVNHTDDWLMTYADMITLLLCFFAVFLSLSIAHVAPKAEPVKETIQPAPPPPPPPQIVQRDDALRGDMPFYGAEHAEQIAADETPVDKPADPPKVEFTEAKNDNAAPPALVEVQVPPPAPVPAAATPAEQPAPPPVIADHLKAQQAVEIEQKGDRITTFSVSSATFFGSGSAELNAGGKAILRDVAENIKSDAFKDYRITVEGHTDDTPIHTAQFPSNWELSTARASAVVHFFLDTGIPAQRLRAAGYADTFPRVPNRDASGNPIPGNQAQNRRVVIKLEKIDKGN